MTEDDIDRSCWLPDGEDALTAEMAKKLGLVTEHDEDGNAMYGRPERHANVMKFLYAERFIDDQQLFDGETFILWRQLFRAFCCGEKRNSSYSAKGQQGGEGTRERGYFLLLNRLPHRHYEAIEYAVDQSCVTSPEKMVVRINSARFIAAFETMSRLMRLIRDELKDAVSAELPSQN